MINVNYTARLELDDDQATEVVAELLQDDFDFLTREIIELKNQSNLSTVQAADLINSMNVRDAVQTLLKYYMVHRDYENFMALYR